MTLELLGILATILAVCGVMRNNHRRMDCFYLWMASNAMTVAIHAQAGIWSLFGRDVLFLILAVQGLLLWRQTGRSE